MPKTKKIRNVVTNLRKDLPRGSGNRLADDKTLLGEGRNESDHAHVKRMTPLQTKMRELRNDPQYEAINRVREKSTGRKRTDKEVKPI